MKRWSMILLLAVAAWQTEMGVRAGIAATRRPRPFVKQTVTKTPCENGQCQPPQSPHPKK